MYDKERQTNSVINVIGGHSSYANEYIRRMLRGVYPKVNNGKLVEFHKEKLGKQSYCFQGEYRYWVWDYGGWRIYVSNRKGIAVEVDLSYDADQTMDALRVYWELVGA